ncbi:hypothetical protein [Pandoraea bronchicola]|uniref:Lipopolysaccharide assembly protein B n=1 Tax=Pandoraea bronchicola TaxID=2508287 RepID=A0A5E5BZ25_9BURK|nr:hypothetical protein [Pandoraea bronchicola]VVE90362.1 Lipopolysaccharide assembly protein B [Pandoraea bronchicola]
MTKPSQRTHQTPTLDSNGSFATNAIAHAWAQVGAALSPHPDCPLPTWTGRGDTRHQYLLITGVGDVPDVVSQLRHLEAAAERFGKVGFVGPANARRLVEWSMGERVVVLSRMPRDVSDWDVRCPLGSLAQALGPHATPAHAGRPFLRVATTTARHWRDRLAATAQHGFCVGFAGLDTLESMSETATPLNAARFTSLAPLFQVPGVSWVPLGRPANDRPDAIPLTAVDWIDWRADCVDLADEAALIDNLDLVISLDTPHAHLAEALGVPIWQLHTDAPASFAQNARRDTHFRPGRLTAMDNARHPPHGNEWPGTVDSAANALRAMAVEFQGWTRR